MENKTRNLLSLKAEFHDKGKASRGLKNIMGFIDNNKNEELKHLLRFHDPIGVYGQELVERFEIDALIEYYNLVLVSVFAGYAPGKLDEITSGEIIAALNNPAVKPYYQKHYTYKMVQYTLQFVTENRQFVQEGNATTISTFNEFISLNRFLKRDQDIERFLGMLDFVWYNNNTINDVNEILASPKKLNEVFTAKNKTEAQNGVWGFIKYTMFLSQLKDLLVATEKYPLLQSSFWMFHGYYFDRMNDKMKQIFNEAFENLEKTLGDPAIFKKSIEEIYGGEMPEDLSEKQLREFAKTIIDQARGDVSFVLDTKWAQPLNDYFSS
ncbi:MAG: hypothetical protein HYZ14_05085 [Bacteroidetes bacterium]|nr:hypothetical protein [Bacteroidota bacterium]